MHLDEALYYLSLEYALYQPVHKKVDTRGAYTAYECLIRDSRTIALDVTYAQCSLIRRNGCRNVINPDSFARGRISISVAHATGLLAVLYPQTKQAVSSQSSLYLAIHSFPRPHPSRCETPSFSQRPTASRRHSMSCLILRNHDSVTGPQRNRPGHIDAGSNFQSHGPGYAFSISSTRIRD